MAKDIKEETIGHMPPEEGEGGINKKPKWVSVHVDESKKDEDKNQNTIPDKKEVSKIGPLAALAIQAVPALMQNSMDVKKASEKLLKQAPYQQLSTPSPYKQTRKPKFNKQLGIPKTEEERKRDHKEKYGADELPPRGTGLDKGIPGIRVPRTENRPKTKDWSGMRATGTLKVLDKVKKEAYNEAFQDRLGDLKDKHGELEGSHFAEARRHATKTVAKGVSIKLDELKKLVKQGAGGAMMRPTPGASAAMRAPMPKVGIGGPQTGAPRTPRMATSQRPSAPAAMRASATEKCAMKPFKTTEKCVGTKPMEKSDEVMKAYKELKKQGSPGPPPKPGLVWNAATRRWRHPHYEKESIKRTSELSHKSDLIDVHGGKAHTTREIADHSNALLQHASKLRAIANDTSKPSHPEDDKNLRATASSLAARAQKYVNMVNERTARKA